MYSDGFGVYSKEYKRRGKTTKYIAATSPLDTVEKQRYFIVQYNRHAKNDPIIFIECEPNIQFFTSLLNILCFINAPESMHVANKMNIRYQQTGFPLTIKAKCIGQYHINAGQICSKYCTVSKKYLLNKKYQYCESCKREYRFWKKQQNKIIDQVIDQVIDQDIDQNITAMMNNIQLCEHTMMVD